MVKRISWGDASQGGGKAGGVAFTIKINMQLVVVLYFVFSFSFVWPIEGDIDIDGSDISSQKKPTIK